MTKIDYYCGSYDNSNSQFAILALWAARKHGLPVDRSLAMAAQHYREDKVFEQWTYRGQLALSTEHSWGWKDSMTCAGVLGLALGRAVGLGDEAVWNKVDEPALQKGLAWLGGRLARPVKKPQTFTQMYQRKEELGKRLMGEVLTEKERIDMKNELNHLEDAMKEDERGHRGRLLASDSCGDLYFLWSVERTCAVCGLKTVGGTDWYAWGSRLLVDAQNSDGSWSDTFPGVIDTSFALLFLRRANIAPDLTEKVQKLGGIHDPGGSRYPGSTSSPAYQPRR